MRSILPKACAVLFVAASFSFAAAPAWSFKCSSGTIGQGTCSCTGTTDCTDMRHSKMCKTDMDCSNGKCSCTAALVADPGTGGTGGKPKLSLPAAPKTGVMKAN